MLDSFCVLVGGEHWKVSASLHSRGNHCSLNWVGRAYEQARTVFPRDRIIVIAQVGEVTHWLRVAAQTGKPLFSPNFTLEKSKACWTAKLQQTLIDTAKLRSEGGADYDWTDVNPGTLLSVLQGRIPAANDWSFDDETKFRTQARFAKDPTFQSIQHDEANRDYQHVYPVSWKPKVIPTEGVHSVLLGLYSHGWYHDSFPEDSKELRDLTGAVVCDLCGQTHSQKDSEYSHAHVSLQSKDWFLHMPYPTPKLQVAENYTHASTSVHPRYENLVYWQHLFKIYAAYAKRKVNTVAIYQFCSSGGSAHFVSRASYQKEYQLSTWPLYLMTACGATKSAVPGGLFALWFEHFAIAMKYTPNLLLTDLYARVNAQYSSENAALLAAATTQVSHNNDCLLCHEFFGAREGLCSTCFKKYSADKSKFDLKALREAATQQNYATESKNMIEIPMSERTNGVLREHICDPHLANSTLHSLFDQPYTRWLEIALVSGQMLWMLQRALSGR